MPVYKNAMKMILMFLSKRFSEAKTFRKHYHFENLYMTQWNQLERAKYTPLLNGSESVVTFHLRSVYFKDKQVPKSIKNVDWSRPCVRKDNKLETLL